MTLPDPPNMDPDWWDRHDGPDDYDDYDDDDYDVDPGHWDNTPYGYDPTLDRAGR